MAAYMSQTRYLRRAFGWRFRNLSNSSSSIFGPVKAPEMKSLNCNHIYCSYKSRHTASTNSDVNMCNVDSGDCTATVVNVDVRDSETPDPSESDKHLFLGDDKPDNNTVHTYETQSTSARLLRIKDRLNNRRLRNRRVVKTDFAINNFSETSSDESNPVTNHSAQIENIINKFDFLGKKVSRSKEKVFETNFGVMRLDTDNKPLSHSQRRNSMKSVKTQEPSEMTEDFAVDDFFGIEEYTSTSNFDKGKLANEKNINFTPSIPPNDGSNVVQKSCHQETNFSEHNGSTVEPSINHSNSSIFDEQYFPNVDQSDDLKEPEISGTFKGRENNLFDEQYFSMNLSDQHVKRNKVSSSPEKHIQEETNIFDEQYFGKDGRSISEVNTESVSNDTVTMVTEVQQKDSYDSLGTAEHAKDAESNSAVDQYKKYMGKNMNYFEEQFLSDHGDRAFESTKHKTVEKFSDCKVSIDSENVTDVHKKAHMNMSEITRYSESKLDEKEGEYDLYTQSTRLRQKENKIKKLGLNLANPDTAFEAVLKMRLEKKGASVGERNDAEYVGKVDSKGFRILKDQVRDLQNLPQDVVVNILHDSILCNHEDVLAIDKPYGLPSHDGPGVHHSVDSLLPLLAKRLARGQPVETMHLVHRLDKETTGVFIIARNEESASKLSGMFSRGEIIKKYLALTKGAPNPSRGIIDIPMAEKKVDSQYRMTVVAQRTERTRSLVKKRGIDTLRAVTEYEVLAEASAAALLEITPQTGVKHQIRCHLAFGLNTPVLGDHKYSHSHKIAPQRLYPETLQRLGIRQSKVRHLPMHLHSKSIIIPEFNSGRNIFISAKLPKHFVKNMRRLKIVPPKK